MKRWMTVIALTVVIAVTAACGAGVGGDGQQVAEQPGITEQAGGPSGEQMGEQTDDTSNAKEAQQRVVASTNGDVTVPAEPQRIVGLSVVYPDFLYALGTVPVAIQNYHSELPAYLAEPLADTLKMGIARTPDFEAILSANPDVIIAPAWWADKDYEQLSLIAPTVLLPQRDDWRDELRDIAGVLGKTHIAEQVIGDLRAKEEQARAKLDELVGEETVLYIRVMAKEIIAHGPTIDRGKLIHQQLGLNPVANFPQDEKAIAISLEVLPEYDADHLIVQVDDETNEEVMKHVEQLTGSAIWSNMKAVKNNHMYVVGGKEWFNLGMSPLADAYVIDAVLQQFESNHR